MNFAPFNIGPGSFFSQFHPFSFFLFYSISLFTLTYLLLPLPPCFSSTVIVNTAIMDCVRLNYSLCRALGELWRNAAADKNASSSAPLQWWRALVRVDQREPFPQGPPAEGPISIRRELILTGHSHSNRSSQGEEELMWLPYWLLLLLSFRSFTAQRIGLCVPIEQIGP